MDRLRAVDAIVRGAAMAKTVMPSAVGASDESAANRGKSNAKAIPAASTGVASRLIAW